MIQRDWSEIGFARVASMLTERTGLDFPATRRAYTEQAMRRAMSQAGLKDSRTFADRLPDDPEAIASLVAEITIGETYFFREPSQLEYIRRSVIPSLARDRAPDRPLRIWSAGCATGEEPYTLAVILREDQPRRAVRITGTEISHVRLEAARRARYGRWSLRSLAEPVIRRYFTHRGSHYFLRPDIRAMVDFGYLNLADDEYPGGPLRLTDLDLILCRNVLIYFDRQVIAGVARRLLDSLADDGWLFLGASDPSLTEYVECEVVVTGAGLAYRRASAAREKAGSGFEADAPVSAIASVVTQGIYTTLQEGVPDAWTAPQAEWSPFAAGPERGMAATAAPAADAPASPDVQPEPPAPGPLERVQKLYAAQDYPGVMREAAALLESGMEDARLRTLLVRSLANSGSLAEAGRACAAALEAHPTDAELCYLHALLLAEAGRLAESVAAARGALFLDRKLVVAHMLLGGLLARMDETSAARRSFQNAERLLAALPSDALVPASDGEPAGRVREAARVQADLMSNAP